MKRVLALCLIVLLALGSMSIDKAYAAPTTATVKGGWLKLRASASTDGVVLGRYYTGEKVSIHGQYGAWYHVTTSDGRTGFMMGAYLSFGSDPVPPVSGTMYVTSENGQGVRLRSGPDTSRSVLGVYSVGTKVTVISTGAQWHYVRIGSTYGYMMSKFLTSSYTPAPTPDPDPAPITGVTATIASENGKSVNMRVGAGTGYTAVGSYAVGTKVNVLKFGHEWSHISVNGRTGYMMTRFLSGFTARVHSANGQPVAMRSGAGTSYSRLTSWSVGTHVTVLHYGSEWTYINVNGWTGYMMTKFLVF